MGICDKRCYLAKRLSLFKYTRLVDAVKLERSASPSNKSGQQVPIFSSDKYVPRAERFTMIWALVTKFLFIVSVTS